MYATERQDLIERLLLDEGRVSVVALSHRFDVTTETVRRDLDALEKAGSLRRVHGGAVPAERGSTAESTLAERRQRHAPAKTAIARRASAVIPDRFQGALYFDAGTTTAAVAQELTPRLQTEPIDVVTHALPIALDLSTRVSVTLVGGRVRGLTSAAVGADTVHAIEQLRPDVAFLGANGVSASFGISTPDTEEAAVKSAIVRAARRVVVVADADKLGQELLISFARLTDIDVLVTDATPAPDLASALARADVEVLVA